MVSRLTVSVVVLALAGSSCVGPREHLQKSTAPTAAQNQNTGPKPAAIVAVFDIQDEAKQFDEKTTDQLTEYLASRVNEVAGYRVIPRQQMRERLQQEKAEGYKSCYDQACQIELGKAVAAQKSLATKVLQVGSGCLMTATLFDLKTETTERAVTAKTECNASALVLGADHLAQELRSEAY